MSTGRGIDPRGPRFSAGITSLVLALIVGFGISGPVGVALALDVFAVAVFGWGAFRGVQHHPYGLLYRAAVRPHLAPPRELEDPAPPTFAQLVGFIITAAGLALHLVGVPWALVVSAALAFVAAFLNAAFGYCLGCQLYLLLARAGLIGARRQGGAS